MTLQEKLEKIKLFLEEINIDTLNTSNTSNISTSETSNVIARPNKRYICSSDILKLFNITKCEYNNILVRTR